jgi:replicative DNA helicase
MNENDNSVPMDLEAERSVLGAILLEEGHYWSVNEALRPDHFFRPAHQRIYTTIRDVLADSKSLSVSVLISRLGPELEDGQSTSNYLTSLMRRAEDQDLRATDFYEQIIETWTRRQLLMIAEQARKAALDKKRHASDHLSDLQTVVSDVTMGSEAAPLKTIGDAATRAMTKARTAQEGGFIPGIDTGLPSLDEILGRIMPTDFGALIASQGDGKTLIAMQLAARAAEFGGALFFEQEMQDEDLARRALAAGSDISAAEIEEGRFDFYAMDSLRKAHSKLLDTRLFIDDRPKLFLDQMASRVIQAKKTRGIKACFYDHARKIKVRGKFQNKFDRMEYITGFLKDLAKETGVPQILLCQRSRSSQRREDPTPQITDFPEGPSLEQDCDWIIGALRRDVWLNQHKPRDFESREGRQWVEDYNAAKGLVEINVLKRRRGEVGGMRKFLFDGRYSRVSELG